MKSKKKMIIHISGPSGSGKTFLGEKLKELFQDEIIVKDLDDLRDEFISQYYDSREIKKFDKKQYQLFINNFINQQDKPIIFVGLNIIPWFHKNHYYNLSSYYNYYIKLDDKLINKQKCLRLLKDLSNDKDAVEDLVNDYKKFIKLSTLNIKRECDLEETIKNNNKWNNDYKKQGYIFLSREDIFDEVSILIEDYLNM